MTFRPIIPGTGLPEHEVIRPKYLTAGAGSDTVHGTRLKVHKNGAWNEPAATGFVVVDVDTLELENLVAGVTAGGVDAVLRADHLPELGSDLIAALAALDVEDFSHGLVRVLRV
ncbi:hypothetical protein Hanom_Chr02g00149431 [Helianthus anomalus]